LVGLISAGLGVYLILTQYVFVQEDSVLPKARVYFDGSPSFNKYSDTTQENIDFTQVSYDTHNAFNLITDTYIIPEDGFYHIDAQYGIETAQTDDDYVIYIVRNNLMHTFKRVTCTKTVNSFCVDVSDIVNATIGDTINIRIYFHNSVAGWRSVEGQSYLTFFSIAKLHN